MRLQARSSRSATSALLPVATAGLAIGIFIADVLTPPHTAVAVLYVAVVLIAARFCRPLGVVLVAAGCMGLTVLGLSLVGRECHRNGDQHRNNRGDDLSRAAKPILGIQRCASKPAFSI